MPLLSTGGTGELFSLRLYSFLEFTSSSFHTCSAKRYKKTPSLLTRGWQAVRSVSMKQRLFFSSESWGFIIVPRYLSLDSTEALAALWS